jgi:NAD-dependent dihydropyrimidine dehydrogenase PreA subunit
LLTSLVVAAESGKTSFAALSRPADCIACSACELVYPTHAIRLAELVEVVQNGPQMTLTSTQIKSR